MKLLITADLHIRPDAPKCRTDDFLDMQKKTLDFIYSVAFKKNAHILIAGDIFDTSQPRKSQELECMLQYYFTGYNVKQSWIFGNHDLNPLSYSDNKKTSLGTLQLFNTLSRSLNNNTHYFNFWNYGSTEPVFNFKYRNAYCVKMLHIYCEEKELPFYINNGTTAEHLLDNYSEYDLIVTGDNHHGFYYQKDKRFVINPGCCTRQKGDMKKYKPRVYLFDTDTKEIETIYLPDNKLEFVTNEHNEEKKEKTKELETLINNFTIIHQKGKNLKQEIQDLCILNDIDQDIINYLMMCINHKNKDIIDMLNDYWERM